jgi:hypothetical protein
MVGYYQASVEDISALAFWIDGAPPEMLSSFLKPRPEGTDTGGAWAG